MITVACVYRTGGDYSWDYVHRLLGGVSRSMSREHRFLVLTDEEAAGMFHVKQLQHNWPGWWSKLELFGIPGPVLYLDLDTVIVGSLDRLAAYIETMPADSLMCLEDFYLHRGSPSTGVMGWSGDMGTIYRWFRSIAAHASWQHTRTGIRMVTAANVSFRGDQEWLRDYIRKSGWPKIVLAQTVEPGILSYKADVRDNRLPDDAALVCFHGRPRPAEVKGCEWMQSCWRTADEMQGA
jgi:hypothetical protein